MTELTTNCFCLTRTRRTQGSGWPSGRDNYSDARRPAPPLTAWSPGHLWRPRLPVGAAPAHACPRARPLRRLRRRRGFGALPGLQLVACVVSIRLGLDGLAWRRRVGRVGYRGQAVGQGHGAGDNAFDCGWDATGGHAHHARGVPAGRGRAAGEAGGRDPGLWAQRRRRQRQVAALKAPPPCPLHAPRGTPPRELVLWPPGPEGCPHACHPNRPSPGPRPPGAHL